MEQGKTQGEGAVKFVVLLHELFAENVAVTVQFAPVAVKPVKL